MLCSVPLMLEYESVLKRPHHLARAGITAKDADTLLDSLAGVLEPVRISFMWRPVLRDVQDEMVLATAVNGHADAQINRDQRSGAKFGQVRHPGDGTGTRTEVD